MWVWDDWTCADDCRCDGVFEGEDGGIAEKVLGSGEDLTGLSPGMGKIFMYRDLDQW
jgi:hypothetical protein